MTYRPLPPSVTIKNSNIEGLGLFAIVPIPSGFELGITHVNDDRFENNLIRTPLGGFVNHADDPNCVLSFNVVQMVYVLKTKTDIMAGDELTLCYNLYSVKGE